MHYIFAMRTCIVYTRVHKKYENVWLCNGGVIKSEVVCSVPLYCNDVIKIFKIVRKKLACYNDTKWHIHRLTIHERKRKASLFFVLVLFAKKLVIYIFFYNGLSLKRNW